MVGADIGLITGLEVHWRTLMAAYWRIEEYDGNDGGGYEERSDSDDNDWNIGIYVLPAS